MSIYIYIYTLSNRSLEIAVVSGLPCKKLLQESLPHQAHLCQGSFTWYDDVDRFDAIQ